MTTRLGVGAVTLLAVMGIASVPAPQASAEQAPGQQSPDQQSPAQQSPAQRPAAQPVPSVSERPNGASLGTIRIGASDEKIWFGWRVAIPATSVKGLTFSEALAVSDILSVSGVEASSTQITSLEVPKPLDYRLQAGERRAVVHRLHQLNQQLMAYRIDDLGADAGARRSMFEFARAINAPLIIARLRSTETADLAALDALAEEMGIDVALESTSEPAAALKILENRSRRLGLAVNLNAWMRQGVAPVDGLRIVKDRLRAARVTLGKDAVAVDEFFLEAYRTDVKPLTIIVESAGTTEREMLTSLTAFERAMWPAMAERVRTMVASPPGQIRGPDLLKSEDKAQIEAAAPRQAIAAPRKPRKLLVTDLQMYSGHATIPHGNLLLGLMGKYTGAFEPVFSNDLELLKYPKIKEFDAVYLNNVCGMVHNDPEVREGILRFIREGGGIAGHHAVTYANNHWPAFAEMMGGWAGAHHVETQTIKIDDHGSPLTKSFGAEGFEHTDEFYIFPPDSPYSRAKQRVLMSIDVEKSDRATANRFCRACTRADQDYGVAWVKAYGKGRTYFTPLGHTNAFYTDQRWTHHLLAAIQYVLGDLEVDATPIVERKAPR